MQPRGSPGPTSNTEPVSVSIWPDNILVAKPPNYFVSVRLHG